MHSRYKRFLARLRKPFRYPARRRARKLREAVASVQTHPQHCHDCGTLMQGPYCHACGQKEGTLRRPIWTFFTEFFDYTLSSDSRFYRTLLALVFMPGFLTREYMNGRRTRYFPPVRLYIVVSIGFFLLLSIANVSLLDMKLVPKQPKAETETQETKPEASPEALPGAATESPVDQGGMTPEEREATRQEVLGALKDSGLNFGEETQQAIADGLAERAINPEVAEGGLTLDTDEDVGFKLPGGLPYRVVAGMFVKVTDEPRIRLTAAEIDQMLDSVDGGELVRSAMRGFGKAFNDPTAFNHLFNIWLPRALLVLMPLFAFILRLTHWGRDRNYVHQLVFSLHFHSFLFLLLAGLMVVVPLYGGGIGFSLFWWGTSLYMIIALKVGEMQGWIRSFLKAGFIWVTYFTLLLTGILIAVFQGLREL